MIWAEIESSTMHIESGSMTEKMDLSIRIEMTVDVYPEELAAVVGDYYMGLDSYGRGEVIQEMPADEDKEAHRLMIRTYRRRGQLVVEIISTAERWSRVSVRANDETWAAHEERWQMILESFVRRGWSVLGTALPAESTEESKPLTPRETEIAGLIADGMSKKGIADKLFICERTVENHARQLAIKWRLKKNPGDRADWETIRRQANLQRSLGEI